MEQGENAVKKKKRGFFGLKKYVLLAAVIVVAVFLIRYRFFDSGKNEEQTSVLTASQLEQVLKISELSIYKVTFNGVAAVNDGNGELLYNVAYNAKVRIGFDMEALQVDIDDTDESNQNIIVTLPKIEIMDAEVDPGSLDYIFAKKSANSDDVSATAFPACKADAQEECKTNEMIFEQATENAVNMVKALTQPLLSQYTEYSLTIVDEGGISYE